MKFKKIYVEITNICNKNCSFCSKTNRDKREMSIDEFETVLKHVFSEKYGNGENFEDIKSKKNEAKIIRAISYSVAHKIYLKKYVEFLKEQEK